MELIVALVIVFTRMGYSTDIALLLFIQPIYNKLTV